MLISFVTCFVILRAERLRIDHRSAGQHATRRRGHASLTTLMAPSLMRTRCVALLMHVGARQPALLRTGTTLASSEHARPPVTVPAHAQPLRCRPSAPRTLAPRHCIEAGPAQLPHPRRGPQTATRTCLSWQPDADESKSSSDDGRAACPRPSGRAEDGQVGRVPAPPQRGAPVVMLPAMQRSEACETGAGAGGDGRWTCGREL